MKKIVIGCYMIGMVQTNFYYLHREGESTAIVFDPADHGREICFPSGMEEMGPYTKKLYDTLTGIQMGHIKAPEGWIKVIV